MLVKIGPNWLIELDDLAQQAAASGTKTPLLSHMCGRIANMEALTALCGRFGLNLIEDCAHTMGARWDRTSWHSDNFLPSIDREPEAIACHLDKMHDLAWEGSIAMLIDAASCWR